MSEQGRDVAERARKLARDCGFTNLADALLSWEGALKGAETQIAALQARERELLDLLAESGGEGERSVLQARERELRRDLSGDDGTGHCWGCKTPIDRPRPGECQVCDAVAVLLMDRPALFTPEAEPPSEDMGEQAEERVRQLEKQLGGCRTLNARLTERERELRERLGREQRAADAESGELSRQVNELKRRVRELQEAIAAHTAYCTDQPEELRRALHTTPHSDAGLGHDKCRP